MVGADKRTTSFRERPRKYTGQSGTQFVDSAALFSLSVGVNAVFMNEKRALYYAQRLTRTYACWWTWRGAEACEMVGEHQPALAFVTRHL